MRIITKNVYKFEELSTQFQKIAIEQYLKMNEPDAYSLIDDCYLFEPPLKDLTDLFGDDYTKEITGNTRKNIFFNIDKRYWYLDCAEAFEVKNEYQFLLYLGIPKELQARIQYDIYTLFDKYSSTQIDFCAKEFDEKFTESEQIILENASDKFGKLISYCLEKIEMAWEYETSEEYAIERIKDFEIEFYENGEIL
jgi:hypothetical protein